MTRTRLDLVTLAVALASPACSEPGCTLELRFGIVVEVLDASSGEFMADVTRGVARDGAYEDSLSAFHGSGSSTTLQGAEERPGIYSVHLEADGYLDWDTTGVRVPDDGCHVRTATFTARLERAT